ncbi:hypothetical protein P3342_002361 [Pyrenophora teres f. teres]|nr:hypothetical protein P3342_002361 [Pyrenophora teres f. teres]
MSPAAVESSNKRKRSHKSKKVAEVAAPAHNGVEKARKKARKEREAEAVVEEPVVEDAAAEEDSDEEAEEKTAEVDVAEENEDKDDEDEDAEAQDDDGDNDDALAQPSGAAGSSDLTSGTTMPMANPTEFAELNLSERTRQAIDGMGFKTMTEIQQKAIPPLLAGRDVLGAAKTGSGKRWPFSFPP